MDNEKIIKKITKNTKGVFLTHVHGFNGLTDYLIKYLKDKKIKLIEDVCESHGATHKNIKLGSLGWASNFSFYYAHHMSTIEGGMICTNDFKLYQMLRMLRAHGLVRESDDNSLKEEYISKYKDLNPEFIFAFPAYNVRNTEIGAIIGRNQLKSLDKNNQKRNYNNKIFLENINPNYIEQILKLKAVAIMHSI